MKIYTKLVIDMASNEVLEEESFDYDGPLDLCFDFGGGSESSYSRPVKLYNWNKPQKLLAKKLFNQLYRGVTSEVPSYPKQMFVPETSYETDYLTRGSTLADDLAKIRADAMARLDTEKARSEGIGQRLLQPAYEITPETTEQYYQEAIRNPAMQEWREIVEPSIREAYVGPGYWGSERARGIQTGAEHLATNLMQQHGELMYKDEQARRDALTQAMDRYAQYESTYGPELAKLYAEEDLRATQGQLDTERMMAEEAQTKAGYSRGIEQEKVVADFQRWLMGETVDGVQSGANNPYYQLIFQALGLSPFSYGTESEGSGSSFNIGILG